MFPTIYVAESIELCIKAELTTTRRRSLHARVRRLQPVKWSKPLPSRRRERIQTQVRLQPRTFPFPKERPERWLPWAIAFTTVK